MAGITGNKAGALQKRKRPRTCVGCGAEEGKKKLLRVVRSPEGVVSVDPTGREPGRGAYLCISLECLKLAKKKNAFSRALKVSVPLTFYDEVEAYINAKLNGDENGGKGQRPIDPKLLDMIGLSARAGMLSVGQDQVLQELKKGKHLLVLLTRDCSKNVERAIAGYKERGLCKIIKLDFLDRDVVHTKLNLGKTQILGLPLDSGMAKKIETLVTEGVVNHE